MKRMFQSLLVVLSAATDRQLAKYVQFLKEENRVLRERLPKRLIVTPRERQRLLKYGQPLGLAVRDLITTDNQRRNARFGLYGLYRWGSRAAFRQDRRRACILKMLNDAPHMG